MRNIVVVPHDSRWVELYQVEAELLKNILSDNLVEIYHIGSTSVPGLPAKPIIDIMPVVRDLAAVDAVAAAFEAIGYEYMGEFGIPGRRYLPKGGDARTHHVHIFSTESELEIRRHLAVPEYLRHHGEDAAAYGALKSRLALEYPHDSEGYCNGKDAFVKELERKALAWYNKDSIE